MFQDGNGKNRIEGVGLPIRKTWPKIFAHDFHVGKTLDVGLIVDRAVPESIVRIHQRDVVTEFAEKTARDRFAAADLQKARRRLEICQNRFDGPGALDVF